MGWGRSLPQSHSLERSSAVALILHPSVNALHQAALWCSADGCRRCGIARLSWAAASEVGCDARALLHQDDGGSCSPSLRPLAQRAVLRLPPSSYDSATPGMLRPLLRASLPVDTQRPGGGRRLPLGDHTWRQQLQQWRRHSTEVSEASCEKRSRHSEGAAPLASLSWAEPQC